MIFVTTGTFGYTELIEAIDQLVAEGYIEGKVVAQISGSKHVPLYLEYFKGSPDLTVYMEQAEYVISHGGTGTIMELLGMNKKVIAVANRKLSGDHQYTFLKSLADKNCLLFSPTPDLHSIRKLINEIDNFVPSRFSFFPELLFELLKKDLSEK